MIRRRRRRARRKARKRASKRRVTPPCDGTAQGPTAAAPNGGDDVLSRQKNDSRHNSPQDGNGTHHRKDDTSAFGGPASLEVSHFAASVEPRLGHVPIALWSCLIGFRIIGSLLCQVAPPNPATLPQTRPRIVLSDIVVHFVRRRSFSLLRACLLLLPAAENDATHTIGGINGQLEKQAETHENETADKSEGPCQAQEGSPQDTKQGRLNITCCSW